MKNFLILLLFLGGLCVNAQQKTLPAGTEIDKNAYLDDRTYEIRYWQAMNSAGNNPIMVDTMVYYGKDRTGFDYSSADCVSYFCKEEDKLIYSILDEIGGDEKEWNISDFFLRKLKTVQVPFRSKSRTVYWMYVSDLANRNTGIGNYALVCPEFGVFCRWNADAEFFQLNRIDVVKQNVTMEELDLEPLMTKLYMTEIFTSPKN